MQLHRGAFRGALQVPQSADAAHLLASTTPSEGQARRSPTEGAGARTGSSHSASHQCVELDCGTQNKRCVRVVVARTTPACPLLLIARDLLRETRRLTRVMERGSSGSLLRPPSVAPLDPTEGCSKLYQRRPGAQPSSSTSRKACCFRSVLWLLLTAQTAFRFQSSSIQSKTAPCQQ